MPEVCGSKSLLTSFLLGVLARNTRLGCTGLQDLHNKGRSHRVALVASLHDCSIETLAYAAEEKVPQTTLGSLHPGLVTPGFSRADCLANRNNPRGTPGQEAGFQLPSP